MINNTMIIAHRGESYDAPENTLASINLAWERNADAVEIDVHLTQDNRVVAIHDTHTKRTGGVRKYIKRLTLLELKKIDVGSWKAPKYLGEKIPTLEEVLDTIPKEKKLIIEVKSPHRRLLPHLKNILSNFPISEEQIEIISFNYATVSEAKILFPKKKVLLLNDLDYNFYTKLISYSAEKLIQRVKFANLDGLNVWAGKILDEHFIAKVKKAGLLIYCWTVNNPEHAKNLISWNIDAITTDRAEWLAEKVRTPSK